jgi:nicotinate-nucleotide adenylyltransferase
VSRIGVYAGSFDPVHAGHISFALQALQAAQLDKIYFLPERRPRAKQHVEHFGHRVAMLRRAIEPHSQFGILELVDVSFSVERTLPELQQQFEGDELVFLFGSDVVSGFKDWPHVDQVSSGKVREALRKREPVSGLLKSVERYSDHNWLYVSLA